MSSVATSICGVNREAPSAAECREASHGLLQANQRMAPRRASLQSVDDGSDESNDNEGGGGDDSSVVIVGLPRYEAPPFFTATTAPHHRDAAAKSSCSITRPRSVSSIDETLPPAPEGEEALTPVYVRVRMSREEMARRFPVIQARMAALNKNMNACPAQE